jgi:transglutaminase-like putative cysteine protease
VNAHYQVQHISTFHYDFPVRVCQNLVLLTPRTDGNIISDSHKLHIRPHPHYMRKRTDFFGNVVHCFAIEEDHKLLSVTAKTRLTVVDHPWPDHATSPSWESVRDGIAQRTDHAWVQACLFTFASPRIHLAPEFSNYARPSFQNGTSILDGVLDLTKRIHADFEYDVNATQVDTPAEEAFKLRKGVCQDFAHIQISCLRSLGIPARYVSGYLRTIRKADSSQLIGADQSHAWLSVYCGFDLGWLDFDPTNSCTCGTDHIPIGWGRDYSDLVPIRGVYLGGGTQNLSVSVEVTEI